MPQTPNHGYNVPNKGDPNWHKPLKANFRQYDTDIEIRDTGANRGNYQPKQGAKFLATDTGVVSLGDGSTWSYESQADTTHMGPMAEDFCDEFGLGDDRCFSCSARPGIARGTCRRDTSN